MLLCILSPLSSKFEGSASATAVGFVRMATWLALCNEGD